MTQPETARELLHRHGLPEDIIDGALCLHAQELAAQQRKAHDELRPYSHMGLPCKPEYECGARRVIDLIDPTRTPAAVSAAVAPPTQAAPSLRAGLRDEIVKALGRITTVPPVAHRREQADHVLAVLYREWPWLRAEAEDAEPTDRAAVLRWAADAIDAETRQAKADGVLEPDKYRPCRDASAQLRRMADETATQTPAADLPTLAAALDGLHTLIATSSRDWGTYRVDAWLWAVLCGWDCEQTEHDDTCVHGALEETAARHGWDEATIAKARRYRAAVRAVTEHQPAAGARQDGAES